MSGKKFIEGIKNFRKDIKSMNSLGQLIDYIPSATIPKLAYLLLLVVVASPLYAMLRSIFLDYHDTFFIRTNQRTVGLYWYALFQTIGILGLLITLLLLLKKIQERKGEQGWLKKALRRHPVPVLLLMMLSWSIFSCIFSSNIPLSLHGSVYRNEGLITYFVYAGIFCCGYMIRSKEYRMNIMKVFVLSATFLSAVSLLNIEFLNRMLSLNNRAAIFQNINHYGYFLCLACMVAAALALKERKINRCMLFWLMNYAVLTTALITDGSYGPYVAVVLGLAFVLILTLLYARKSIVPVLVILAVFVALTVTFNMKSSFFSNEATQLAKGITDIVENNEKAPYAGSNRWKLWQLGIRYTLEKPLFGYGPENLYERYQTDGLNHDRPHNEVLQLAASLGIPAALLYLCAIAFYFWPLMKNRKLLGLNIIGSYGIVFTYLVSSMVGLSIFYTTPFYFMMLGLTCNLFRQRAG